METALVVEETPNALAGLFERVSAHDRDSFTELVRMLDADLLRLAFVVSGDVQLAEDAVQIAWERLWHRPPLMREPQRIRSWLLTVAANEARRASRRRRRGSILEAAGNSELPIDPSARLDVLDLQAALPRLSPADRELLALRFVLDVPSPEIATHLNLSPEGVRTRIRRALARLREEMNRA